MRQGLVWAILIGSAVAAVLSEVMLFRMFDPPDAVAALLGGAWVGMPFLGTAGLAMLVRRSPAALAVMLVALLGAGFVGVSVLKSSADQQAESRQQVRDAVQPGEDPSHGPAAKRQAGAEMGATISSAFAIAAVVFVPPVQLAAVVIPTLIGYGVSALFRRREGVKPAGADAA
jgi:hypothetical protein